MVVPGNNPPAGMEGELFAIDAYRKSFDSTVTEVDRENGRVALARTTFFPGGGGQPHDLGGLRWDAGAANVRRVGREGGRIWHWLDAPELPDTGTEVAGELDWDRRYAVMRTHTALHILCGVMWEEFKIAVTGGNMEPGKGRLDFPLESISMEIGRRIERRINDEIERAREILVNFTDRSEADLDPALIRIAANLIPQEIDPLRVIEIVGLDKQADGGTHVASTAEVGGVVVTKTESRGKGFKRIRVEVVDAPPKRD